MVQLKTQQFENSAICEFPIISANKGVDHVAAVYTTAREFRIFCQETLRVWYVAIGMGYRVDTRPKDQQTGH